MTSLEASKQVRFVKPAYSPSSDGDILLYAGDLVLSSDGIEWTSPGDIVLRLEGRANLRARFAGSEPWMYERFGEDPPEVRLPDTVCPSRPISSAAAAMSENEARCKLDYSINMIEGGQLDVAVKLLLHISGELVKAEHLPGVENGEDYQKQLALELGGWSLVLAANNTNADDFSFVIEATPDRLPIRSTDVSLLTRRIVRLLSFVAAADIGVSPIVGLDAADEIVWLKGGAPRVRSAERRQKWCWDGLVPTALPVLAVGLSKLSDPGLEECIDRAIGLWLAANGEEVLDVKIPLACSGLELLSWSVLQHRRWLAAETFKKTTAAEQVRLLLQWANIPIDLPATAPALARRIKSRGKADWSGPEVMFEVRNKLTHPPSVLIKPEWPKRDELFEAWLLANWYLELVILRLLDYRGEYVFRLRLRGWVGETVPVPWA